MWFCVLATVSSAAVNVGVHVSFEWWFSRGYRPRRGCQIRGFISCMRRLSSLGVMAMSIPTNCVVGVNRFLALSHLPFVGL